MTEQDPTTKALNDLVKAWNKLPGGQNHGPRAVERWLRDEMKPAVDHARRVLKIELDKIRGADDVTAGDGE